MWKLRVSALWIAGSLGISGARNAAGSPRGGLSPRPICVVRLAPVEGLARADLRAALLVAARKRSLILRLREAAGARGCAGQGESPGVLRLILGSGGGSEAASVRLDGAGGGRSLRLGGVLPEDRPAAVASAAVEALLAAGPEASPLITGRLKARPRPPPWLRPRLALGGLVALPVASGKAYGGMELEVGVALFDEALVPALVVSWLPERGVGSGLVPAALQTLDVALLFRGRLSFGPVMAGLGVGGGVGWSWLEARPDERIDPILEQARDASVRGGLEIVWRAGPTLRPRLLFTVRRSINPMRYTWLGDTIYEAPVYTIGLLLGLGFVL